MPYSVLNLSKQINRIQYRNAICVSYERTQTLWPKIDGNNYNKLLF